MRNLHKSLVLWRQIIFAYSIGVIAIYICWFLFNQADISPDPAHWGQFGDYIGGILNPAIALAAFYWLSTSVKIQSDELSETRKALTHAAESQASQAKASEKMINLQALTALLSSAQGLTELASSQLLHYTNQVGNCFKESYLSISGDKIDYSQFSLELGKAKQAVKDFQDNQISIAVQIQKFIDERQGES